LLGKIQWLESSLELTKLKDSFLIKIEQPRKKTKEDTRTLIL